MYKPKFTYTDRMVNRLMEIESAKTILDERRLPKFWIKEKQERCFYNNITDTLKMENQNIMLDTVRDILTDEHSTYSESETRLVKNYSDAIKYIDGLIEYSGSMLNVGDIKEINQFSLQDIPKADWHRGKLREIQNWVVDTKLEEIVFTAPSPERVPELLNDLILWLKTDSTVHPLIRAGVAHHRFMYINPFVQGNERTACLIEKYILLYEGYFADSMVWLSGYYSDNISEYFQKLSSGLNPKHTDEKNLTEWLEYFIAGLHRQFINLIEEVKTVAAAQPVQYASAAAETEKTSPPSEQIEELNERQRLILQIGERYSTFHRRDIISEMELAGRYHPKTISRDLRSLVASGYLKQSGERKGIRYSLAR